MMYQTEGQVDGTVRMKRIESKGVNLRLVSSRGMAKCTCEGSICSFYKPVFNEMLDFEGNCFQCLLEEEDTLFKMHNWERERKGNDPAS
jgi:hypothetical protein